MNRRPNRQRGATVNCCEAGSGLRGWVCVLRDALISGLIAALVAWAWIVAQDPATLPVRAVTIEGRYRYVDEKELRGVVRDSLNGGFLSVDLGGIERSLEAAPWIASASVRRQWPDRLRIDIVERQPVARWGDEGLVTATGVPFYPDNAAQFQELPVVYGPEGAGGELVQRLSEVRALLGVAGLTPRELIVDERRAWHLWLQDGIRVSLGRGETDEAIARFVRAWPAAVGERAAQVSAVDLRYTNGFSVLWKEDSALEQGNAGEKNS
ncbi:MAG: cell division protein FtsQ/DivIB [Gammaproteobacteria bacterium]|jgi:cell division protein FtsQ|nr:cell division protein FtsQ/DivIB [Gammaproteobacteria bacterium]